MDLVVLRYILLKKQLKTKEIAFLGKLVLVTLCFLYIRFVSVFSG